MPKHKKHQYIAKLILGKSYPEVDRIIDFPYRLFGRKHRRFFHNRDEAILLGTIASSDSKGGLAGLLHILTDEKYSKDKNFKKWLDILEQQDRLRNQQMRQFRKLLSQPKANACSSPKKQTKSVLNLRVTNTKLHKTIMKEIAEHNAQQAKTLKRIFKQRTKQPKKRRRRKR